MKRFGARSLLATLVLSACARPVPPARPAPVPLAAPAAAQTSHAAAAPRRDSVHLTDTDIERGAVEVFGRLAPADHAADSSDAEAPTWDIDVRSYEAHARVEHFVSRFSGDAREVFSEWLARGSRYEPVIRAKLRAGGIPEDMYYLALVESGFDPNAYSRAAAVGLWQFMASTARGTGLRVDWWVDERRDPIRSTDAAVKFLGWLRDEFGSLYLAAAAYNGGPGRVSRGLTRFADDLDGTFGDDRFFALAEKNYLPRDTKDYVPQIIAAALVAKEPERYGLTVRTLPPFEYDTVSVPPSTPLAAIAKASGATTAEILELNTHILRGVTPPDARYVVRIPVGRGTEFDSAFATLDRAELSLGKRITTKKGETLARIAAESGLTARQLAWYNPKVKSGALPAGQSILVPTAAVVAAARDVPDPSLEIYGRATTAAASSTRTHVVRSGETLGGIAKRYDTSVAALKRLNGLHSSSIRAGQRLTVHGKAPAATVATRSAGSVAPKPAAPKAASAGKNPASKGASTTKKTASGAKGSTSKKTVAGTKGKSTPPKPQSTKKRTA